MSRRIRTGLALQARHVGYPIRNWKSLIGDENGPDWARTSDPALIKRML
jgi:hypothetical protein